MVTSFWIWGLSKAPKKVSDMNKIKIIAFALIISICLCGCTVSKTDSPKGDITFTDDMGRTVNVKTTKNVAALLGSFAHIWTLAGGEAMWS